MSTHHRGRPLPDGIDLERRLHNLANAAQAEYDASARRAARLGDDARARVVGAEGAVHKRYAERIRQAIDAARDAAANRQAASS